MSEHGEGRCPHDVIMHTSFMLCMGDVFSYQCGVYACSFNITGYARTSDRGTSKEYSSHIFFCAVTNLINKNLKAESGNEEANDKLYEKKINGFDALSYFHSIS